MTALGMLEREAAGDPEGLLILHHGRGADEADLLPLGDVFDPRRRLHVVTPRRRWRSPARRAATGISCRGSVTPTPRLPRGLDSLAALHDALWERTGIGPARTVLGGFSMGTVMSYAPGSVLDGPCRRGSSPSPASSPRRGFEPDLEGRGAPMFIAHGRRDPVIGVPFGRAARESSAPAASMSPTTSPTPATRSTRHTSAPAQLAERDDPQSLMFSSSASP